ncbi:uncharacterized mitochondrial protein-like protein [Tanacetum coccineum]
MKDKFQMSSMGKLTFFLGLQVQQKDDGIFISHDKYVAEILKKFNYSDVKSASTLVDLEKPLVKDRDADDVDVHLYRSMIGSLMHLTTSRLDIMFAVYACARFQVTPKTSHLLAVKRIFRYLKGKPTLGLWYSRDSPFELVAYTDNDYAGETQDMKSTTGAEYVAAASCCGQVLWIQNKLLDYRLVMRLSIRSWVTEWKRAATTASSLEAEQDIDTILRDVDAQTRFETTSKQSNNPPLSRGYTLGSGEDNMKLLELMELCTKLSNMLHKNRKSDLIRYALIVNPTIYTSCIQRFWATAKTITVNGERGTDCLPTATIFDELARIGYEKPSQKLIFYKAFFSPQ